jgi:predicted ArsR family transcriptional regulator
VDRPSPTPSATVTAATTTGPGASGGLSATDFSSAVTAITSAFGDPTRREIYLAARGDAVGVTATEVARRFDLHPNVARHHLDKLAAGGSLEVGVAKANGSAGRPSKRYRATAKGELLDIPVRHDDVLVTLLGRALDMLAPDDAEAMAEEVGVEYGRLMAASIGDSPDSQRSFRSALHTVADALTAHGFAAHAERRNDELRIVAEHCPFGDAVLANPVICAVDRGMVKGMVAALYGAEAHLEVESSKPMGGAVCITAVEA